MCSHNYGKTENVSFQRKRFCRCIGGWVPLHSPYSIDYFKLQKENVCMNGLMVSVLAYGLRGLAGDIVLCSFTRHCSHVVPLSTQVYKWVPTTGGLIQGGLEILLVTS